MRYIILQKSHRKNKRYMVIIENGKKTETVHFGDSRYYNYLVHNDDQRKKLYINRHKKNETWGRRGIYTAGFWSRWLLWEKKTINKAIKNIERKFRVKIKNRLYS